jgi:hypothetical protein
MSKVRGRPFEPGNTLGRGRPKGSRNQSKSAGQGLFDEYGEHLIRKTIALGMAGDINALRICLERVSPPRRDNCVQMNLPAIRNTQDLDKAAETVSQGIRRGKITPAEGGKLMNIFESRARIIERVQWEERIAKLEGRIAPGELPLAA